MQKLDPGGHRPRDDRLDGHGDPYIALNTPIDRTKQIWEIYDKVTIEAGFTPGPDYHGMLKQIHVAETQEKALKNAA